MLLQVPTKLCATLILNEHKNCNVTVFHWNLELGDLGEPPVEKWGHSPDCRAGCALLVSNFIWLNIMIRGRKTIFFIFKITHLLISLPSLSNGPYGCCLSLTNATNGFSWDDKFKGYQKTFQKWPPKEQNAGGVGVMPLIILANLSNLFASSNEGMFFSFCFIHSLA